MPSVIDLKCAEIALSCDKPLNGLRNDDFSTLPSELIFNKVIGKPVVVKLHSGVTYKGVLACLDGFMNIAMEQTEEYVDGQLKNKYGDCFIRGNNVQPRPRSERWREF
eukprot:scaffold5903_cov165-Ochromonas_danica.AAC.13